MKFTRLLLLMTAMLFISVAVSFADVQKYYLEFSQDDINMIFDNAEEDIYIYGTIKTIGNPVACRMRVRGDGTRQWPKKSLKVVFDGETLDGREKINFNAEYEDFTYMNSVLSSQMYRSTGHPCFDATHAALYLNGEYWGLFVRIENMDEEFLEENGLSKDDDLYKATHDGACLSDYDDVYGHWEKKTNENSGRENLQHLIDTLDNLNPAEFKDFALKYFDYDKMVNFISVNLVLSNFSTYYHNYYMFHRKTGDSKWMPIPWDMDKTFYKYGLYTSIYNSSNFRYPDNPMLEYSFLDARVKNDIINRVEYLLDNHFQYYNMVAKVDSLKSEIRQYVEMDNTDDVKSIDDWESYIEKTKSYMKDRPEHLRNQLNHFPSNFRVEQIDKIVSEPPTITWEKSESPDKRKITYQLRYNTVKDFYSGFETVDNIEGESYTFPDDLPEGKYYYDVRSFDQYIYVYGTDNLNYFIYRKPNSEYCHIDSEVRLTKDNSPYVIDCDMQITKDGKLIIDPGVELFFTGNHKIDLHGELIVNGTNEENNTLASLEETGFRNRILLSDGARIDVNYTYLENVAIQSYGGDIYVDHCDFFFTFGSFDDILPFILGHNDTVRVSNSTFKRKTLGQDGVFFRYADVIVENCVFDNIRDATELVTCTDSKVLNNVYYGSSDDAIDFNGGINIEIAYNSIYNALDKGISIGNHDDTLATNFKVHHNIIVGCGIGTSFKDNAEVDYYNNTLYLNAVPLEALRMSKDRTKVRNTIFNYNDPMLPESLDKLAFSYNLSDKEVLPGTGNLQGFAEFADAQNRDFSLLDSSPAIDAGDPNSPKDADGTRADIGALAYSHRKANVVINEIHYNQDDVRLSGDWMELYNNSSESIDISGWYVSDSDDMHKFYMPAGTILKPHGFLVVVEAASDFTTWYNDVPNYIGDMGFGFSGKGEIVRLYDAKDKLIDYVEYDDAEPWPVEADGDGYTLSLIDPDYDNALPESWYASEQKYGTPGKPNNENKVNEDFANEGFELYPLPAKDYIIFKSQDYIDKELVNIKDSFGRAIPAEVRYNSENSLSIDISGISSGVYFITINKKGNLITGSFIVVK